MNNTGFEMPMCVTSAFKCVRLQVINTGFEMPIYVTCTFYANILGFEMPRYTTHALQLAL